MARLLEDCKSVLHRLGLLFDEDEMEGDVASSPFSPQSGGSRKSSKKQLRVDTSKGRDQTYLEMDMHGHCEDQLHTHMSHLPPRPPVHGHSASADGCFPGMPSAAMPQHCASRRVSSGSSWGSPRSSNRSSFPGTFETHLPPINEAWSETAAGHAANTVPGCARRQSRPVTVPKLHLELCVSPRELSVNSGDRPASLNAAHARHTIALGLLGRSSSLPMPQRDGSSSADADLEVELASWAKVPTWAPAHEGRSFVYKPVNSMDVRRLDSLLSRLPPDVAGEVHTLWGALQQARYSCELMASRGVRVAKDVTKEWVETSRGLMSHIESCEAHIDELKSYIHSQDSLLQQAQRSRAVCHGSPYTGSLSGSSGGSSLGNSGAGHASFTDSRWDSSGQLASTQQQQPQGLADTVELEEELQRATMRLQQADREREALRRQQNTLIDAHFDVIKQRDDLLLELEATRAQLAGPTATVSVASGRGAAALGAGQASGHAFVVVERVPQASPQQQQQPTSAAAAGPAAGAQSVVSGISPLRAALAARQAAAAAAGEQLNSSGSSPRWPV